jgi:hypothetical protein
MEKVERVHLEGVDVALSNGVVYWCSDWSRLDDPVFCQDLGLVREFTLGHGDPYAQSVRYLMPV